MSCYKVNSYYFSFFSRGRKLKSQDEIFQTLDKQQIENEKKILKDMISSKEWRLTEGRFNLCSKKIESIVDKALSLYKEGFSAFG